MATIKGQNLRIFIGGKVVAMATSATVHASAQVGSNSTKDDGDWDAQNIVGLQWDASVDALVNEESEFGKGTDDMLDLIGQEVAVSFALASGANHATEGSIVMSGRAVVSDISINTPNRQDSSYTCQLTGTEDLVVLPTVTPSFNLPITQSALKNLSNAILTMSAAVSRDFIIDHLRWKNNSDEEFYVHDVNGTLKVTDGSDDFITITPHATNNVVWNITVPNASGPTWKAIYLV